MKYIDTGTVITNGEKAYKIHWRSGSIDVFWFRDGGLYYRPDSDSDCQSGFPYASESNIIVFQSQEKAWVARDQGRIRIDEILCGFKETLRQHFEKARADENAIKEAK